MKPCGCGAERVIGSDVWHCTQCHETKPSVEFSPRKTSPYLQSHCLTCSAERRRGSEPRRTSNAEPRKRSTCGTAQGVHRHREFGERLCAECRRYRDRIRKRRSRDRQRREFRDEFIPIRETILDVTATFDYWVSQQNVMDEVLRIRGSAAPSAVRTVFSRMVGDESTPWKVRRVPNEKGHEVVYVWADADDVYNQIA